MPIAAVRPRSVAPAALLAAVVALLIASMPLGAPGANALAADAPEAPKPPTTPLPDFENPLHDAEIGETCFYRVRQPGNDDGWIRYFEERVLARRRVDGEERVLVETIETDATGTKEFSVFSDASGWRNGAARLILPPTARFVKEREREEVLIVGPPPGTVAVRTTRRVIEFPTRPDQPDGPKTQLSIWFSHDVPGLGRAKQFPIPSVREGERVVISWDKRLAPEVCATRAERYRDEEMLAKERERKKKEAEAKDAEKAKEGEKEKEKEKEKEGEPAPKDGEPAPKDGGAGG